MSRPSASGNARQSCGGRDAGASELCFPDGVRKLPRSRGSNRRDRVLMFKPHTIPYVSFAFAMCISAHPALGQSTSTAKPGSPAAPQAAAQTPPSGVPVSQPVGGQKPGVAPHGAAAKSSAVQRPSASQPTSKPKSRLLQVGRKAPKFEAYTLNGATVRFPDDYAGQLVLLHVWASWCPSCARDYPFWVQSQELYGGAGLTLLGISVDYEKHIDADGVRAAMQKRGGTWEVIYDGAEELQRRVLAPSLPTLYLVDGDSGKILAAGEDLRRGRLMATLEKQLSIKFPDHKPASRPSTGALTPQASDSATQPADDSTWRP